MERTYEQYRDWLAEQTSEAKIQHVADTFERARTDNAEQREAAMLDVMKLQTAITDLNDTDMMAASMLFMMAHVANRSKSKEDIPRTETAAERERCYEWAIATQFDPCWERIPVEFKKGMVQGQLALVEATGVMFYFEAGIAPRPEWGTGSDMWLVIQFYPIEPSIFGHIFMSLSPDILDLPEEKKAEGFEYFQREIYKQILAYCLTYKK